MRKVMLKFKLVGKSFNSKRKIDRQNISAKTSLDDIKLMVGFHFGDRPIVVIDENTMTNDTTEFPEFYSAGWFVSNKPVRSGTTPSELVVVAAGNTMQAASFNLMEAVSHVDWENYADNV